MPIGFRRIVKKSTFWQAAENRGLNLLLPGPAPLKSAMKNGNDEKTVRAIFTQRVSRVAMALKGSQLEDFVNPAVEICKPQCTSVAALQRTEQDHAG